MPAESEAAPNKSTGYAIVMASAPGKNLTWVAKKSPLFDGHSIFVERISIKGSPWERLCLGGFDNRKQAASLLSGVQKIYPGAWIQPTPAKTTTTVKTLQKSRPARAITSKPGKRIKNSSLSEKQLNSLMQRAKTDFTAKNYASAIRYLTALTSTTNVKYSREALELLGLARQRNNQTAHAVTIYKKYLVLYPDGEDSDRVRQRLVGLLTATSTPRKKIHREAASEDINDVTAYGSLSQTYLNNRTYVDGLGSMTTLSQLITFFDVTAIQKTNRFDHRYQVDADYINDFENSDNNNEFRFFEAYYELSYRKTGTSGRLGRQSLRIGATRRRFDGISAGYQINQDMRINVLGGYPVALDYDTSVNTDNTFYGFTFETGTFLEHWDMNLFYFDQKIEGLTDSNNVGTEVRYNDNTRSVFGMIDYDLFYDEINTVQLNANLLFDHGRTAYLNAYIRKTPMLATRSALIGRPESNIEELKKTLNNEQIYQLAKDRTTNSQTVTIGGLQPLTEKVQVTADITVAHIDSSTDSGGVVTALDSGTDYLLSAQLVGNSFFINHDTNILGIRYYDTSHSNTIALIANTRYPITPRWRINPRLQFDMRNFNGGGTQNRLRARFKTDYRYLKKVLFNFEVGYEDVSGQTLGNNSLFFNLGYRWDF